jgi:hypothetical protein
MDIPPGDDARDAVFDYDDDLRDDDGIVDAELAFGTDAEDLLTDGYSPPDAASAVDEHGTAWSEQRDRETIVDRELRTHPESWAEPEVDQNAVGPLADSDDGHLVDTEADLIAREVAGGASADLAAEEAAIHRIDPLPDDDGALGSVAVDEGSTNT